MSKVLLFYHVRKPLQNLWTLKSLRQKLILSTSGIHCCAFCSSYNPSIAKILKIRFGKLCHGAFEKRHINSGFSIGENNDTISDSLDRIDRHVSLGRDFEKTESTQETSSHETYTTQNNQCNFNPRKILVLSKLSRYQFERQQHPPDMSETEFRHIIEKRGSDYTLIKYYHNVHKAVVEKTMQALEKRGLEVKLCQRMDYCDGLIEWADLVITAGGDGTFLLGASMLKNRNQPIMGINTDPTRSEGHLCIQKHWSLNVDDAIQALVDGKVKFWLRPR